MIEWHYPLVILSCVEDRIAELLVERAGDPPTMLKVTAEGDEIRLIHG